MTRGPKGIIEDKGNHARGGRGELHYVPRSSQAGSYQKLRRTSLLGDVVVPAVLTSEGECGHSNRCWEKNCDLVLHVQKTCET